MSSLIYLASDAPLPEKHFPDNMEMCFYTDTGVLDDGGTDDCFELIPCMEYQDVYTEKKYAVALGWNYYTEGRAAKLIDFIRENLLHTDEVEIWYIWMGSGEKPIIRSKTILIDTLIPNDIHRLIHMNVLEELYEIPIQYRIIIKRDKLK